MLTQGQQIATEYTSNFYDIGVLAWELLQPVMLADGTECQLWQISAGDEDKYGFRYLSELWDMPESSVKAAHYHISFYYVILGWELSKLKKIGRGKLTVALWWLKSTWEIDRLDKRLIGMLEVEETKSVITQYVATAKSEMTEILEKRKKVHMDVGSDVQEAIEAADSADNGSEVGTDTEATEDEPTTVEDVAEHVLASQPVRIVISQDGEQLSKALVRALHAYLGGEADAEIILDFEKYLTDRYGGQVQHPLIVWEDDIPTPVGFVVLDSLLEDELREKVYNGLMRQLGK